MRKLDLPKGVAGHLFLSGMPGRYAPWPDDLHAIVDAAINCIVCLAPMEEVLAKSPDYAAAIERGLPCERVVYPIRDYGVPDDVGTFSALAQNVAARLRSGRNVLVHCGAGIGRTGMFATAVLVALGEPLADARQIVQATGSDIENPAQRDVVATIARQLAE